jgi:hypothetical protein
MKRAALLLSPATTPFGCCCSARTRTDLLRLLTADRCSVGRATGATTGALMANSKQPERLRLHALLMPEAEASTDISASDTDMSWRQAEVRRPGEGNEA